VFNLRVYSEHQQQRQQRQHQPYQWFGAKKPQSQQQRPAPVLQGGWDRQFASLFYALPTHIQEQAKEKYRRWQRGEVPATQWHKIWEWKKSDIWELTIGDYRAFAIRQGGNRFNFYWIGSKQAAAKMLTSAVHSALIVQAQTQPVFLLQ